MNLVFPAKQFDDEEGEVDEPLAPLPDEPEGVEGDEDDQDEARNETTQVKEVEMDVNRDDRPSEVPPPPKPQLTLMQSNSELDMTNNDDDGLSNPTLKLDATIGGHEEKKDSDGLELDISGLGPDGLQLGSAHDLSQLDPQHALMADALMEQGAHSFGRPT